MITEVKSLKQKFKNLSMKEGSLFCFVLKL
jgi:hypothetical protein